MGNFKYLDDHGLSTVWGLAKEHFSIRDNDFNYQPDFIPGAGQICLVDTARSGLKIKIGDGTTKWSELAYFDANADTAGIAKLYSALGDNTDGSINQQVLTNELLARYKTSVDEDDETLVFSL